jgi:formylmethanofuran dehydrogenase subunit E
MIEEADEPPPPEFYPCDSCGQPVPAERAFAPMETLDVFCDACLSAKLKPCEECGNMIYASAYQHLPTGQVLCEPCTLKRRRLPA